MTGDGENINFGLTGRSIDLARGFIEMSVLGVAGAARRSMGTAGSIGIAVNGHHSPPHARGNLARPPNEAPIARATSKLALIIPWSDKVLFVETDLGADRIGR
jgi:hypothetical protein